MLSTLVTGLLWGVGLLPGSANEGKIATHDIISASSPTILQRTIYDCIISWDINCSMTCHFLHDKTRKLVALASLPGSGNTWVRALLERATGVCTGSDNCDLSLGFCGEGYNDTAVLVVKTHCNMLQWKQKNSTEVGTKFDNDYACRTKFDTAIFLIRNPFNASVAEYNRRFGKGRFKPLRYLDKPKYYGE